MSSRKTYYIRKKCVRLKYKDRIKYIQKYQNNKDLKYTKYKNTKKITSFNNKLWKEDEDNISTTKNYIITYQKTFIDELKLSLSKDKKNKKKL